MLTKPHRVLGWIIFLLGAVGLAAALVLTVEYLHMVVDSETVRSYGVSAVLYRWRWLIILVWVAVIAAVVISRNYEYLF